MGEKPHVDRDNSTGLRVTKRLSGKKRYVHIYVIYVLVTLAAVIPYSIVAFNPDIAKRGYFTASKHAPAKPAQTRNIETERGLLKIPGEYIASYIIDKAKSSVAEATTVVEVESSLVAAKATDIASMVSDVASKASSAASKVHLPNIASKASEMVAEASAKVFSEAAKLLPTEIEMGSRSLCVERNETMNCKRDPDFSDMNEHLAPVISDASQWESLLKYALFANGSVASAIVIGFPLFALLLYTLQVFEPQLSSHWSFAWLSHAKLQRWLTVVSFAVLCISFIIAIVPFVVAICIFLATKALKKYYTVRGCSILVCDSVGLVLMLILPMLLASGHIYIKRAKQQSSKTNEDPDGGLEGGTADIGPCGIPEDAVENGSGETNNTAGNALNTVVSGNTPGGSKTKGPPMTGTAQVEELKINSQPSDEGVVGEAHAGANVNPSSASNVTARSEEVETKNGKSDDGLGTEQNENLAQDLPPTLSAFPWEEGEKVNHEESAFRSEQRNS